MGVINMSKRGVKPKSKGGHRINTTPQVKGLVFQQKDKSELKALHENKEFTEGLQKIQDKFKYMSEFYGKQHGFDLGVEVIFKLK